jgi:hypothetical protein
MIHHSSCANAVITSQSLGCQSMYRQLTDEWGFKRGYIFRIPGIFTLLKYQVNKIMEKPDYIIIMAIFNREFVLK